MGYVERNRKKFELIYRECKDDVYENLGRIQIKSRVQLTAMH